jgi:ATP-dependent exoDNAse (exonuclease V) alpha subunit
VVDFKALAKKRVDKRQRDLFVGQDPGGPQRLVEVLKNALAEKGVADKRLSVDDLSDDQQAVFNDIVGWIEARVIDGENLLTVGGLAGSGKSTLIGVLAAQFPDLRIAYATFTGRAASVLQRKLRAAGVSTTSRQARPENFKGRDVKQLFLEPGSTEAKLPFCGTLHKLLYRPLIDEKEEIHGWSKRDKLDRRYDLIVVDEASMVGDDMLLDLQVHKTPILAVGDHGQLPPVMSSGNLMADPVLKLTKIHRQARTNPIIRFARHVRKTGELSTEFEDGEHIVFDSKKNVDAVLRDAYANVDAPIDVAILCWTNKSRIRLNLTARRVLGFKGAPSKGELLICLKNMRNANADIYNGMRGVVAEDTWIGDEGWELEALVGFPEESIEPRSLSLCAPQFNRERVFGSVDELKERGVAVDTMAGLQFCDFGYALTVHKSQGSQMKHVIVWIEEGAKSDPKFWKRWLYTATTRAVQQLTILT